MPRATGRLDYDATARKWLTLAERRLLDLSDLYRSGRWVRYYDTKEQFAVQILDAIKVAKVWARMAGARRVADAEENERSAA
jgi:hypothetical protein